MKNKSTSIILCSLILISLGGMKPLKAQTVPAGPRRTEVYMSIVPGDSTMKQSQSVFHSPGASLQFKSNTQLNGTMAITLANDTSNIDSVTVSLGTTDGGGDLFQKTFDNSQQGTFPDGTSYLRHGYNITIGLGQYTGLNSYYAQVFFRSKSGGTSSIVSYVKP